MNLNLASYLIYLPVTAYITVWVGWVCYKNGELFLRRMLRNDEKLVKPVNKLLLTGYYLINIGYATFTMAYWVKINTFSQMIEVLTMRIGTIMLLLAFMHYLNITAITIWHHYHYRNNKPMYNQTR